TVCARVGRRLVSDRRDEPGSPGGGESGADHAALDAVQLAGVVRGERPASSGELADSGVDSGALIGAGGGGLLLPRELEPLALARTALGAGVEAAVLAAVGEGGEVGVEVHAA